MIPYETEVKAAAAIAIVVGWSAFCWHQGGLASKSALEAAQVAQLRAVVKQMDANAMQAAAETDRLRTVEDAYDAIKDLPPVTAGLVERMRYIQGASCHDVPSTPTVAGGTQTASGIPRSDPEGSRLLQDALDAADRDAKRLDAIIQLAP